MQLAGDHYEVALPGGRVAVLTLDPVLQEAAENVLKRARAPYGAVVVMSVDGRLLALAGRKNEEPARTPAYDLTTTIWAPAASIFKIVTAAALVDDGINGNTKVCFHGGLRSVMESNLTDSRQDGRCEDLAYGVAHSQNAIIAKLVHQHLQPSELRKSAERFGFGAPLDFALAADVGRVTVPDAKGVDFAKVAAGFWQSELSPLGGALLANTVASGGKRVEPRLVAAVVDGGRTVAVTPAASERALAPEVARDLARMMAETCDEGSAAKAFRERGGKLLKEQGVAGKTGTLDRDNPYLQYSWFVGFAPTKQPEVSIAVLLGNSELWHLKAHTAARLVLEQAFKK
jgi:cell division protein FtsI/penicillin-binding protein 2